MKLNFQKSGATGLVITVIGSVMLGLSFLSAYAVYNTYFSLAQINFNSASSSSVNFVGSLNSLLQAAIVVMFLGIMGWVGSSFLLRGVEFMKVDRGVGVVTFKVDKGVGVVSSVEVTAQNSAKMKALDFTKAEQ